MLKILLIMAFGSIGAVARYWLAGLCQGLVAGGFPVGTLCVNVLGCLLIGLLGAFFASPQMVREEWRVALLVGLLGAFTTFSTFGWETVSLISDGQWRLAALNVTLNNVLGIAAVWFAWRLGERWFGV
jgi:CrcB protein